MRSIAPSRNQRAPARSRCCGRALSSALTSGAPSRRARCGEESSSPSSACCTSSSGAFMSLQAMAISCCPEAACVCAACAWRPSRCARGVGWRTPGARHAREEGRAPASSSTSIRQHQQRASHACGRPIAWQEPPSTWRHGAQHASTSPSQKMRTGGCSHGLLPPGQVHSPHLPADVPAVVESVSPRQLRLRVPAEHILSAFAHNRISTFTQRHHPRQPSRRSRLHDDGQHADSQPRSPPAPLWLWSTDAAPPGCHALLREAVRARGAGQLRRLRFWLHPRPSRPRHLFSQIGPHHAARWTWRSAASGRLQGGGGAVRSTVTSCTCSCRAAV